jgi:hypothetical protein
VIEIMAPPPGPNRNQCVVSPGMCTRVPGWGDQILVIMEAEVDLPIGHIEGLVPRMAVRRRAAAFGSALTEESACSFSDL